MSAEQANFGASYCITPPGEPYNYYRWSCADSEIAQNGFNALTNCSVVRQPEEFCENAHFNTVVRLGEYNDGGSMCSWKYNQNNACYNSAIDGLGLPPFEDFAAWKFFVIFGSVIGGIALLTVLLVLGNRLCEKAKQGKYNPREAEVIENNNNVEKHEKNCWEKMKSGCSSFWRKPSEKGKEEASESTELVSSKASKKFDCADGIKNLSSRCCRRGGYGTI